MSSQLTQSQGAGAYNASQTFATGWNSTGSSLRAGDNSLNGRQNHQQDWMYNTQHTMQQAALTFEVREAIEGDEALKAEAEGVPIKFAEHLKELEQHLHKE